MSAGCGARQRDRIDFIADSFVLQIVKPHHIEKNSNFLLKNMAFFFIPAGVSILDNYRYVKGNIVPLLLVCLITTVLTFWAASRTVAATIKL